jgi:hypothetical protein
VKLKPARATPERGAEHVVEIAALDNAVGPDDGGSRKGRSPGDFDAELGPVNKTSAMSTLIMTCGSGAVGSSSICIVR